MYELLIFEFCFDRFLLGFKLTEYHGKQDLTSFDSKNKQIVFSWTVWTSYHLGKNKGNMIKLPKNHLFKELSRVDSNMITIFHAWFSFLWWSMDGNTLLPYFNSFIFYVLTSQELKRLLDNMLLVRICWRMNEWNGKCWRKHWHYF